MQQEQVVVLGDLLLDAYTIGTAQRISPEAPVPVVVFKEEKFLPGGAGNVALNLKALGINPLFISRIGDDFYGEKVFSLLEERGICASSLVKERSWPTPTKKRIVSDHQQICRLDHEVAKELSKELEDSVQRLLASCTAKAAHFVVSDYGKGFVTREILQTLLTSGKKVLVDPKGRDFSKYKGAYLLKPNKKELLEASGLDLKSPLEEHAKIVLEKNQVQHLLVTLAEEGAALFSQGETPTYFPTAKREVLDVTGAGDTVLATLSFALSQSMSLHKAIEMANSAGGISVEKLGCQTVQLNELLERFFKERKLEPVLTESEALSLLEAFGTEPLKVHYLYREDALNDAKVFSLLETANTSSCALYLEERPDQADWVSFLTKCDSFRFIIKGIDGKNFKNKIKNIHPNTSLL